MFRIMDGLGRPSNHPAFELASATAFIGESADCFRVKAHDLGHGHIEVSAHRPIVWHETDWTVDQIRDHLDAIAEHPQDPDEIREKHRERAARRAKSNVRRLCKVMGAVTLMTLTYRQNQTDLELHKKHVREFVRRVRRIWPSFMAVAAFEQQKRGAWHCHLACPPLPAELFSNRLKTPVKSFNLLRSVWRSVVGVDNGTVNVKNRKRNSKRSPAKLAAYLSKYILKAFREGLDHSNRWTKYGDFTVPPPVDLGTFKTAMEAIQAAYYLGAAGQTCTSFLSHFQDMAFFAFEGVHPGPS